MEVVWLWLDLDVAGQGDPAGDDDDEDDYDFDDAEQVLEAETPFEGCAVDEEGGGDAG